MLFCFLFFKQKTAYEMRISDWSSDVCSSDLVGEPHILERLAPLGAGAHRDRGLGELDIALSIAAPDEAERVAAVALDHGRLRLLFEFGADSEIEVDAAKIGRAHV